MLVLVSLLLLPKLQLLPIKEPIVVWLIVVLMMAMMLIMMIMFLNEDNVAVDFVQFPVIVVLKPFHIFLLWLYRMTFAVTIFIRPTVVERLGLLLLLILFTLHTY